MLLLLFFFFGVLTVYPKGLEVQIAPPRRGRVFTTLVAPVVVSDVSRVVWS